MGSVHLVNLAGELPQALREIRLAQESAQRVLDENPGAGVERSVDLGNLKLMERYFEYYFYDRRQEMGYPVGPEHAERDDTVLNMLAENSMAVTSRNLPPPVFLRQSFMAAGNAFEVIDSSTRGVVVPYGSAGKEVIAELCSTYEPEKQFRLLRRAQQYTVNVFPHVLERLQSLGAVHEVQEGTGVLYLGERWYSDEFGLNEEGKEEMEFSNA
jgi:CRISPR-associated endonuclease/helicase Cas3